MKILINYADGAFQESKKNNLISGIYTGGFDSVIGHSRQDISEKFFKENEKILSLERGAGFWLWKPYIIKKTLESITENDILFYSDAGAVFVQNLTPIFDKILEDKKGIVAFELAGNHTERQYTKREVLKFFDMDNEEILNSDQRMASFIGLRKTSTSLDFIDYYLECCTNENLILDVKSKENQHDGFIDHRHDQSIWSLLVKMDKITTLPDPTQWGIKHNQSSVEDCFIEHHRNRK